MRFDLITIFPEFFAGPLNHGIVRRAMEAGIVQVHVQDLREFTKDRHRTVDDRPFGGGEGMVLKPEPLFEAVESLLGHGVGDAAKQHAADPKTAIVLMSAAGKLFNQETARKFAKMERIIFVCGRYEGVDERVAQHLATEEISIGDFVLSGGELPAMMIVDAVTRLLPGALGMRLRRRMNRSVLAFRRNRRRVIPCRVQVLRRRFRITSSWIFRTIRARRSTRMGRARDSHWGNHAEVAKWRRAAAIEKTCCNRPDLLPRE